MLRLFFVRHGETDYNARQIVQGSGINASLNVRGISQATRFYHYYGQVPFRAVYTSNLKRTIQTMAPFRHAGHQIHSRGGLDEICWGELEGGPPEPEVRSEILKAIEIWRTGDATYAVPGGESPVQVWQRAQSVIDEICSTYDTGNILVCLHGRTLRVILSQLSGYGYSHMHLFQHANTSLSRVRLRGSMYEFECLNNIIHMSR